MQEIVDAFYIAGRTEDRQGHCLRPDRLLDLLVHRLQPADRKRDAASQRRGLEQDQEQLRAPEQSSLRGIRSQPIAGRFR